MAAPMQHLASPAINPETERFWEAAAEGRLMIGYCEHCNTTHWYPRAVCPHCFNTNAKLKQASGRGIIYSFTIMRSAKQPYVLAYVTLEEGPTVLTNIIGADPESTTIGQEVRVEFFRSENGQPVPMFTAD